MTTPNEGTPSEGTPSEGTPTPGAPNEGTPTPDAPVEYKFVAPEGVTYDTEMVAQVATIAKELKLPQEAAQKFVDQQHSVLAAQQKAIDDTVAGWKQTLAADPELGGAKFEESRATANKVLALGPKELPELLESSGMIHHPVVFKFLHSVGKMLSEDRFVPAGGNAGAAANRSLAKVLYPNNA